MNLIEYYTKLRDEEIRQSKNLVLTDDIIKRIDEKIHRRGKIYLNLDDYIGEVE